MATDPTTSTPRDRVALNVAVRNVTLDDAANRVLKRAENYDAEHGSTDPETGTREYPGDGAEYVGELNEIADDIRSMKTDHMAGPLEDLAALVSRLARSLRQAAPDNDLPEKAVDYLRRHGLTGSPLRDVATVPAAMDVGAAQAETAQAAPTEVAREQLKGQK